MYVVFLLQVKAKLIIAEEERDSTRQKLSIEIEGRKELEGM